MLLKNQMKQAMMAKGAPDNAIVSGNTRVKVSISGQVNRAIRFASSGDKSDFHSVDNGESNSRVRIVASAKLNAGTTAVAFSEWAMAADGGRGTGFSDDGSQSNAGNVSIRHSKVDLVNKDLGTLSLGHSVRADAGAIFTGFNGTSIVFHGGGPGNIDGLTPEGDGVTGGRLGVPTNVYPGRENRIQYTTPNIMGTSVSVSYQQSESWSLGMGFASPASMSKDISIKVGIGYRDQPAGAGTTTFGISGGVQHNPSGLSLNGVYAQETPSGGAKHKGWALDVSWTGKLMEAGTTSLTLGYGDYEDGVQTTQAYWAAINQRVDSAAADLYMGVSHDTGEGMATDGSAAERENVIVVLAGTRIKF